MMQFITLVMRKKSTTTWFFPLFTCSTTIINPDFVNGMLQESAHIIYREEESWPSSAIHSSNFAAKVENIAVKVNDALVEMAF